jgi:hypothetical protein
MLLSKKQIKLVQFNSVKKLLFLDRDLVVSEKLFREPPQMFVNQKLGIHKLLMTRSISKEEESKLPP